MAQGRNLNYYRGQYDPSDMYANASESGIVSMYNPESQNRFIDAVSKRQERFDLAKATLAQEKARIGETETYDMAELTKRLQEFEGGITSMVKDKYNGDYSAAATEIANKIGTERSNPFYHFNKQKVEMGKAYLDTKMKLGANFMSAGNPLDVSFQDWQAGKTFEFTPINSADITQRSASLFQNFSKKLMSDSGLMNSPEGQYFRNVQQYGFQSPQEAMAYAQKSGLLDQLYESMPELAGVENQEAVANAIAQGASYGIGTTKVDYMQNQEYMNPKERAAINGSESSGYFNLVTPTGAINTPEYQKYVKDAQDKTGKKHIAGVQSFSINRTSSSRMSTSDINEVDKIHDNLAETIKLLAIGNKPSEAVSYMDKSSKKNAENMDATKGIEVTDFALSPFNHEILFGISGVNKEGKRIESRIILDSGDMNNQNNEVLNLIPYLDRLGNRGASRAESAEFNNLLDAWLTEFYTEK